MKGGEDMELTKDETICIFRHLVAQHRQAIFKKISNLIESCEKCPISKKCFESSSTIADTLWYKTFSKLCSENEIKNDFILARNLLEPYGTEDS